MSPAPPPPPVPQDLLDLTVRCLEILEVAGMPGVAAMLAAHPEEAQRLLARLIILGDLGLLPESTSPSDSA